ncbi:hypothetical protein RHGRI_006413 [Rhododendron griersonianum]|uniref:RRM domain-containing protein n=1 Tax=Rhododendron griersonianum TaxID=479676 RepID=A0AAV6KUH8_9ERIC|nr:hypothetical protein RHGRI_006413 [Rhododendron griersonianum]
MAAYVEPLDVEVELLNDDQMEEYSDPLPPRIVYGAPQRSIEGWIILVTGVHVEAKEDDIHNAFADFGEGYALIEYKEFQAAKDAISTMNGAELLTQTIFVDWAFSKGHNKQRSFGSVRLNAFTVRLANWFVVECHRILAVPGVHGGDTDPELGASSSLDLVSSLAKQGCSKTRLLLLYIYDGSSGEYKPSKKT